MSATLAYHFTLPSGSELNYEFEFDGERYVLQREHTTPPPWTELAFQQCSHCPFQIGSGPKFCPAALQLSLVVDDVEELLSFDKITVQIRYGDRINTIETSAQEAIGSLLGLILACSGCPHTEFLLPMARFHQPIATTEETLFRACGSFLLAQHFRMQHGHSPEPLDALLTRYQNLETINRSMIKRLKNQLESDTCLNAIVILDNYAKLFPHFLNKSIDQLKPLYAAYLL